MLHDNMYVYIYVPVVPHKAVAEVSKIGNYRRKFRSQISDNMDRSKKQRWQESKRREGERRSEKRKNQKKEFAGVRKSRKVASHSVFPMICASGG